MAQALGNTTREKGACVAGAIEPNGTALHINGPVGQAGRNDPADVKQIQAALNRVPASKGGPQTPLVVDGLVGPKTVAAISRFQSFHFGPAKADGRVDPNQYTIAKLREFQQGPGGPGPAAVLLGFSSPAPAPGATPPVPPAPIPHGMATDYCKNMSLPVMTRVKACLELALKWNIEALVRLDEAIQCLNGTTAFQQSLDLVDRCFKVKSLRPDLAKNAMFTLQLTFARMIEVIGLSQQPGNKSYFQENNTPPDPTWNAWAVPGGYLTNANPDTSAVNYHTNKIAKDGDWDCEDLVDLTNHELAHFAGPKEPDAIHHAPGKTGGKAALLVSHHDAIHNASCYAWLSWLARLPSSEWLTNTGQKTFK